MRENIKFKPFDQAKHEAGFQAITDEVNVKILEKMIEIAKNENMGDKYKSLGTNLFGFELFEEVFKVINERGYQHDDQMFKAGVASAEAAVRRLREEYYEAISTAPF